MPLCSPTVPSTSPGVLAYHLVLLALPAAYSACTTAGEIDMQSLLHPDWTGVEILSSLGPKPNYIYIEQEGVKAS